MIEKEIVKIYFLHSRKGSETLIGNTLLIGYTWRTNCNMIEQSVTIVFSKLISISVQYKSCTTQMCPW